MKTELNTLLENIVADYAARVARSEYARPEDVQEFADALSFEIGRKYIKIIKKVADSRCVWGFIVNTATDKKFNLGDILMAASWKAPARNKARGNILEGGYEVRWTGPLTLS